MDHDMLVRVAAFKWLGEQVQIQGEVLTRELLRQGFEFQGTRVPLISPQGIFKPRIMDFPLSITTSPNSPYDDVLSPSGFLGYRYRGIDPSHRDNVGLRQVFEQGRPIIYLKGIVPGRYLAIWPTYIVGDDPQRLTFEVALDDVSPMYIAQPAHMVADDADTRRRYLTTQVRQRMHQTAFRERVIEAYQSQCAFCQLRHRELLDAAHIIPDSEDAGEPVVTNGLALCKLHHAAFDKLLLGLTPDYEIVVREDVLAEEDGPMLQHGLKELHHGRILLPNRHVDWPDRDALAWRYARFRDAA